MIKIDAIVREEVYEDLKDALNEINVHGMTISQVMGCGTQKGHTNYIRGQKIDIQMVPKLKFEIVLSTDSWAEKVIQVIRKVAYTGEPGDGKIFLYELKEAVRIRTNERGMGAIN